MYTCGVYSCVFPVQVLTAPMSLSGATVKSVMAKPPMGHRVLAVKKERLDVGMDLCSPW